MMGLLLISDQASARLPKNLMVAYSSATPPSIDIHGDKPKPPGIVPTTIATPPTVSAYGSCVRTCSMWLQPLAIEDSTVVSEIGEQ